ncbi:hypothetical protein BGX38DRAFT_1207948 [Terfezia claveryi]|nr:hypothetical protein BGX38DRAFT_1207948 [Terfezia claveryi]
MLPLALDIGVLHAFAAFYFAYFRWRYILVFFMLPLALYIGFFMLLPALDIGVFYARKYDGSGRYMTQTEADDFSYGCRYTG